MKKKLLAFAMVASSLFATAQVGINCQFFPGIQVGSVKIKTDNSALGDKIKYGAGLPLMMIDRVGAKWYFNVDMNALYYGATQTNRAAAGKIKIAKTEGGFFASRVGYLFGKGDLRRFGFNLNIGYMASNLDSVKKAFDTRGYMNMGAGLIYYQKIGGKIRVVAKVGYEKYSNKSYITSGKGTYFEGTIGYSLYQKFGISLMPCFYSKKFEYTPERFPTLTNAKLTSFVIRMGITKFL